MRAQHEVKGDCCCCDWFICVRICCIIGSGGVTGVIGGVNCKMLAWC